MSEEIKMYDWVKWDKVEKLCYKFEEIEDFAWNTESID